MGREVTVGVQLSAWSPKLLGAFHKLLSLAEAQGCSLKCFTKFLKMKTQTNRNLSSTWLWKLQEEIQLVQLQNKPAVMQG